MSADNGAAVERLGQPRRKEPSLNDTLPDFPVPQAAPSPPPRRASGFSVWRLLRRSAAVGMAAAAVWWLVVPLFFPVTSQAVVNARMVQVRTPIDGAAAEVRHDIGDSVRAGEPLMKVAGGAVDTSHLAELDARRSVLAAQRRRLESDLEAAKQTREECRVSTRRFYQELVGSLKASLTEADARVESAHVEREAAHVRVARVERLALQQMGADSELDLERENETVAARRIEEVEAGRTKLRKELQAAEQGFLFQRASPASEARAVQLDSDIPAMETQVRETDEKLAAADKEWQEEKARVERLSEAAVASPVAGTVWKRDVELGQVVKQHENLLEIADPDTIFVEALMNQTHLTAILPGGRAVVRLSDGRVLNGRVRAVRTLGGSDTEASFAVNLPCPDVKQARVLIDLDRGACDASLIGRHARVLIVDERPGPLEQGMMWLFARLGV